MRGRPFFLLILLLLILLPGLAHPGSAKAPTERYFPETGHTVSGPFLSFYDSLKDPLLLLGYPLTERYFDPLTQHEVQYFQKTRLELLPTAFGQEVRQAPLGELLYDGGAPLAGVSTDGPACRYFESTGHSVCYAFWQFYNAYEGEKVLGDPISEVELREMRMVQYFQKGRLEWRTEMPEGHRVVLTDLGRIYFDKVVGSMDLLRPVRPDFIPATDLKLKARAFVEEALAPAGSQQTVNVIVQDQYLRPVASAGVGITITYPDGSKEVVVPDPTGTDGISVAKFTVKEGRATQIVQLDVTVTAQGQTTQAATWFRLWW